MEIKTGTLNHPQVLNLLTEHLADMNATSPPESVHALDVSSLSHESVTFWTAWQAGQLMGCAALKRLDSQHVELKSMRTASHARQQGVATLLLDHALDVAKREGVKRVSLETGSMAFFAPARALYEKSGFRYCDPFADYALDANSQFMTLTLEP